MKIDNLIYVEIKPKSRLKFYFWSGPYRLPKKKQMLNTLSERKIEFVVALGKHTMNEKCYNRMEKLIKANIGLNVCLLAKDFAHIDNSNKFPKLYNILKRSPVFKETKEIYIDAEISNKYRNQIRNSAWNQKIAYIFRNYPSKKEYQKAIKDYNNLGNLIRYDGKKFGIIRPITAAYEVDKITRNIPFKEIDQDITVPMVYRVPMGKEKEYHDYWFYQIAKKEGKNIFLGGIGNGYRSLKTDITICSYLKKKRVYIYDYYDFQKSCSLKDLKPYKKLKVKKDLWETFKHKTTRAGIQIADKFLKFF
ncbi:MAG: hypothetical protein GF383_03555 [Candidatus Lokiarchaeota archaeon]|nr:hypothetical protein [Candidatus Lokiarchaeota archaeon]MBD3338722.1 hypothetical protein [Candidatus Lokiarchaeota archaeon]